MGSVEGREGSVRFGSVTVWEGNGSSGSGFRFWRFLSKKGFSVFQYSLTGKNGSRSGFGSWKTVPAVPVPLSVSGKTVPTAPVPVRFLSHPEKGVVPICSDLGSLFSGMPDLFRFALFSSDLFRFASEQTRVNQGNPFLPSPFRKSPNTWIMRIIALILPEHSEEF